MNILKDDVSPCLLLNGAKAHALIVCERKPRVIAFAQNTREEVRILGEDGNVAGCVSAESGTHQTTYLVLPKRRNVPHRTPKSNKINKGEVICANPKMGIEIWENVSCTILATSYKEPPIIFGASK